MCYCLSFATHALPADVAGPVQGCLQIAVVSPRRVHVVVFIIVFEFLHLLLLLVVIAQHFFVGLLINGWLLYWRAATFLLQLHHEFLLFVLAEDFVEVLLGVAFFAYNPEGGVLVSKIFTVVHLLVPFFFIFKHKPDGFIFAETVVTRVGHHNKTSEQIELLSKHLHVQCNLSIDLGLVHHLFGCHALFEDLLAELFTDEPASSECIRVLNFTAASLWRHFF